MQLQEIQLTLRPEFNQAEHSYTWEGWQLPGVSKILDDTGLKQPFDRTFWRLSLLRKGMTPDEAEAFMDNRAEEGRTRGSLVHFGIETAIKEGKVQLTDESPEILQDYMPAFDAFSKAHDLGDVYLMETPLIHPTGFYCGTVDCVAELEGKPVILDWKTTEHFKRKPKGERWQLFQLVAYLAAINTCSTEDFRVLNAANVFISKDGFHVHQWTTDEIMEAWGTLQGLLRDYWLMRRALGKTYHHPDLAARAVELIEERWGPFEDVA